MSNTEASGLPTVPNQLPANPFFRGPAAHVNAGTVEIESSRAIAEAQGKLVIAKRFPRDEAGAFANAMAACSRPNLAKVAQYAFPRSNQTVSGPSIRLAEELARCWGNIDYGIRELSRKDGVSEMEAYAWDLETNVMSSQKFTVRHIRDTKGGGKDLTDERDIYELTANMGGRRLRARILAILPPDLVDSAVEQCRKTLAGDVEMPISDRIKRMVVVFGKLGVSTDLLEARLTHKLDATTPDELADLHGIYSSIKDGMTSVGEWFGAGAAAPGQPSAQAKAILDQATAGAAAGQQKSDAAPKSRETKKPAETKKAEAPPADSGIAEPQAKTPPAPPAEPAAQQPRSEPKYPPAGQDSEAPAPQATAGGGDKEDLF